MYNIKYSNHEGNIFDIELRTFDEFHGITLCCVVLNEGKYIEDFIAYYRPYVNAIAIVDGGSADDTVEIAASLVDKMIIKQFDGHYSNQLNRAIEMARTDWVFFIEPDERLGKTALEKFGELINQEEYDCYSFPRREYVDNILYPEIYPDYQERLFRTYCRRVRPIHGETVGYHNRKDLPKDDIWDIIHSKKMERHKQRNNGYSLFQNKFANELGKPGSQTKVSFEIEYPSLPLKDLGKFL